jgi:hypothetical protein
MARQQSEVRLANFHAERRAVVPRKLHATPSPHEMREFSFGTAQYSSARWNSF